MLDLDSFLPEQRGLHVDLAFRVSRADAAAGVHHALPGDALRIGTVAQCPSYDAGGPRRAQGEGNLPIRHHPAGWNAADEPVDSFNEGQAHGSWPLRQQPAVRKCGHRRAAASGYEVPMRVSVNAFFLQQPYTGSGQYIRHLLPALTRIAPTLDVVPLLPAPRAARWSLTRHSRESGNPTPRHPLPTYATHHVDLPGWLTHADLRKVWWEQVTWMRASRGRAADVAHVPYFAPPLWSPRPLVVTIHDLIPLILPEYVTRPHVRLYNALISLAARRAAQIIADSQATADDIVRRLGIASHRIHVVPLAAAPGMEPMAAGTQRQAILRRFGLDQPFVFYIGGFDSRKNVPALLRAFYALPAELRQRHVLAIAGAAPGLHNPRLFPPLRPLAEALGLGNRVRFLGRVTEEEKRALYSAATLFVFPSLYEGFGLDPLEAMACGAPVLASNRSSLPEVVGGGAALVEPTEHAAFTRSLAVLLDSPRRRAELSKRGSSVAATFSWDRTATMTLEVYRQARARDR